MSKEYKLKNETLVKYIENNEAKHAAVGSPTLISLEDCDIVALRTIKEYKANLIKELEKEKEECKKRIDDPFKYDIEVTERLILKGKYMQAHETIELIKQT